MTTGRPDGAPELGTHALLDALANGDPAEVVPLRELLRGLGQRSFGMLLIAGTAPAFIPVPGLAGALSGPLVTLVGLQLLLRLRQPWLPTAVAQRGPQRSTMARLRDLMRPWLLRLGRLVRPRATMLLDAMLPQLVTGLSIVVLGLLLWLPIPFTNYALAGVLLLFALALLERDGLLMLVSWTTTAVVTVSFGALSGSVIDLTRRGLAFFN